VLELRAACTKVETKDRSKNRRRRSELMDEYRKPWFHRLWTTAKSWHRIRCGPISLLFRFARSAPPQRRRWIKRQPPTLAARASHPAKYRSGLHPAAVVSATPREVSIGPVLIAGVGPRFGTAATHYLSHRTTGVALLARSADRLNTLVEQTSGRRAKIAPCPCDLSDERQVRKAVQDAIQVIGVPRLFIYAAQNYCPGEILNTEVAAFEESWRSNCLGAFIVGREIARSMVAAGRGTMIFMGGTSSLLARQGYLNLVVGKFGLRAMSHVMARELGPRGVHVTHCLIDAEISDGEDDNGPTVNAEHLVAEILRLHLQPPDCWTSELDMRPATERFWEHC
jgi:NAD(P)-dependent dehydrogenase (short-subunit alcohol dehydrogenase family)